MEAEGGEQTKEDGGKREIAKPKGREQQQGHLRMRERRDCALTE
jgi:hypothetical protein